MKISRREAIKRVGLLMGGALTAPALGGVLAGCRADPSETWTPQVLSDDQDALVTSISELIIPETDTPGAQAAQVNRFIDKMMSDWYPEDERSHFLAGLDDVNARCQERYSQPFLDCTTEEQTALLTTLDEEAFAPRQEAPSEEEFPEEDAPEGATTTERGEDRTEELQDTEDTSATAAEEPVPDDAQATTADLPPFFRTMKELTLLGYYTSEIGMTQEVLYNNEIVPGRYEGCLPLLDTRRPAA